MAAPGRPEFSSNGPQVGDHEVQQQSSSSASLRAEHTAAPMRRPSNRTLTGPVPSSNPPPLDANSASSDVSAAPKASFSIPQRGLSASYAPQSPSPLSPGTTPVSTETQGRSSDTSKSSSSRLRPQNGTFASARPTLNGLVQQSKRNSAENNEKTELEMQRSSGPLTIPDLGADYTRYHTPFSDSRRSSYANLAGRNQPNSGANTPLLRVNPFTTPNASASKLNIATDPEKSEDHLILIDDRLAAPYQDEGRSWPLATDGPESDDELHLPSPDDDARYRPSLRDRFRRENILSTIGLILLLSGLLMIFVGLPVLSSVGIIVYDSGYSTPLDQIIHPKPRPPKTWATINSRDYPLLKNVRTGLIDPMTPDSAQTKKGVKGDRYVLVFSDEFNENNRSFYEGDDPYWFAPDFWYGATQDMEWYDPDAVTTYDGVLELRLDRFPNHGLQYRSGMLNSWNQLCFKGGIFEVGVSLPGPPRVMGLWPGAWTMGNLGRPGYLATTDGLWPYTYDSCDVGITPNQSSSDGLSNLPGQRLPSCTCPGEDHPTPGRGRGAPEIDIFEGGTSWTPERFPIVTQSYQVAPFDVWWYPDYEFTMFPDYGISWPNGWTGGPYQQAISATTQVNSDWFDGKAYQKYSFEYVPGQGEDAYIAWRIADQMTFMFDGRAIGPNGNIAARQISQEPMSMVLNLGFSTAWAAIEFDKLKFPAVMRVDYVRWYQKEDSISVTCDPPGWNTTEYIKQHPIAYNNHNLTHWDNASYPWPKHRLNGGC